MSVWAGMSDREERVLERLREVDDWSFAWEIGRDLGLGGAAVGAALRRLRERGLVTRARATRFGKPANVWRFG